MNPYDEQEKKNLTESETKTSSTAEQQTASQAGAHTGAYPYPAATQAGVPYSQQGQQNQYHPYQQQQYAPPQQSSYSWGPQNQATGYYVQQPQPKQPKKKRGGRFFAKALAAVLACAVVSLGSVGVFAAMIQNGVINVQNPEDAQETAAFTLYKRASSDNATTPTATRDGMTTQEVAQKVIPSVVCVQNYQVRRQEGFSMGGFEYFFGGGQTQEDSGELSPAGEGSGIIISEDGYIVTNQHVINGATNISVVTADGVTYEAELVGEDTQTDLAVIKITTDDKLTPAEFGSSDDLQVTDQVLAIGNPGGLQFNSSVTIGYVSALNRPVTNGDTGFQVNCIQTDAAINPGNSGGALVNTDGLVVGINSSKIAATEYEGMGFAIPSTVVQPIVSDLIEHGYVKDRAVQGFSGQFLSRTIANFYGFPQGYCVGTLLTEEAKASGLQTYDTITAIDDTQVVSENTIASYIANKKPGDKVTLTVERVLTGESGIKIELTLSENTGSSD